MYIVTPQRDRSGTQTFPDASDPKSFLSKEQFLLLDCESIKSETKSLVYISTPRARPAVGTQRALSIYLDE